MKFNLISTSLVQEKTKNKVIECRATPISADITNGFYLQFSDEGNDFTVCTYLSNAKTYKKADALMKESVRLGFSALTIQLSPQAISS